MKKIFVVEDDVDTLDIMEWILQDNGYAVIKTNRLVSINEIISINPSLAILDVLLLYGFGSDLCLAIKNNPKSNHIPVILYSANNNLKKLAHDSLADAYLAKPFDRDKLLQMVNETIL